MCWFYNVSCGNWYVEAQSLNQFDMHRCFLVVNISIRDRLTIDFLISDNFSLTCSLWCRFVVSSLSRLCAPQHVNYKAILAWMKSLLRLSRSSQRLRRKFRHSKWLHRLNLMHVKRLIFDHKCRLLTKTTTRQRRWRVTLMQHRALHRNYSVHEHIFQCSRDEPKKCVNRVKKIEDNDLASSVCRKNRAEQSSAEEAIRWNDLCSTHCVYGIRDKNM